MRFAFSIFFILILHYGFSQVERKANDYFEAGSKLEEDLFYREAFPYFLKSSELAIEGSELWLKAVYKTGYLYNYAEIADKPLITQRTIKGLRYLRKQNFSGSFAADYFFRAGLAFKRDYRPDSAIYFFSEAKNGYQSLSDDEKVSDCYHGIGDVYKDVLFDFNSAESFYEKALAVREKVKRNELNVFLVSKLHYELASVNKSQHEYDKALAYSLKNIAFIEGMPIMYNANKSLAYVNAAEIYTEIDSFSRAENLYQKAITLNKRSSPYRIDPALGEYYYGLATVLKKKGEINSAIKYLLKALAIFNSISGPKNVFKIISYQKLGEAYQSINEMELSGFYFRKGIQLLHDFGLRKSGQASELYRLMGNYFTVNQKMDSALLYYQYSLIAASNKFKSTKFKTNPLQNDIRLGDFAYEALLAKSEILSLQYKKTGKRYFADHAIKVLDLAEKLLLDSRANLDMDNSKWTFFDSNFGLYQKALSLLYQLETNAHNDTLISKAFYYMESSKTKMLTDALNEAEFTRTLITSDSLIQFLDLQRRNLYQLQDEFKRQEGNTSKQVMLHNSIIDVDRKIQRTENEIQLKYPAYIKTKYRQEIPDITKIQSFTDEQKMTVIEFFWGITDVFGLGIHGNKIIFKRIGATDSINQIIKNVHAILSSDQYDNDVKVFEKNSALLYQQLVAPFSDVIKSVDRIVIIPDGPIEQIPFEVLVSKRNIGQNFSTLNYLLKDYFISYSFSSVYLLNTIRKEGLKNPRMLAFGFTQGEQFRSLSKEAETKKSGLPGSETELKSILSQFPEGEYHFGKEVTEEMFKVKAPDFDLIHLAVHGSGSTEQSYSASLFFKDSIISKEDGRLHWYELFGIRLKARLAVISSCESGIGKSYRGEGMLSMASAFAFAGCKNIVMGLWKVDDRVSSDLMSEFYRNLQEGESVDVALTKSKREYLENSDNLTANPKLWASLISYGNEQVIETDNKFLYWSLFSIMIFIWFFFIVMRYKKRSTY